MFKKLTLFACGALFCCYACAQTTDTNKRSSTDTSAKQATIKAPDTIIKTSPLKTLTYTQYSALLNGDDLYNMSLVAELNHFPMPDKAIKYKRDIGLSPIQVTKISAIAKELHRKRLEMGLIVINNERTLDSLFRTKQLDDGTIIFYANRYGLYQGELRNAILQACYATAHLMSPKQVSALEKFERHK
jgi:hypothetical protein